MSAYHNEVWKTFSITFITWFAVASMMTHMNFILDGYFIMLAPIWSGLILIITMLVGLFVYLFPFSEETDMRVNPGVSQDELRGYRDFLWLGHLVSLYVWFVGLPITLIEPWCNFAYFAVIMIIVVCLDVYRSYIWRKAIHGS